MTISDVVPVKSINKSLRFFHCFGGGKKVFASRCQIVVLEREISLEQRMFS